MLFRAKESVRQSQKKQNMENSRKETCNILDVCNIVEAVKSVYRDVKATVRTDNKILDQFEIEDGLRQRGSLSPLYIYILPSPRNIPQTKTKSTANLYWLSI